MQYISFNFAIFTAIAISLYYIIPKKLSPAVILICNLVFYYFSGTKNLIFLCVFSFITYLFGIIISHLKKQYIKTTCLITYLLLSGGGLFFLKFADFTLSAIGKYVTRFQGIDLDLIYPLGIAFFTLEGISYVCDIYKEKYLPEKNPICFLAYITFFPTVVQGPVCRYNQISHDLFEKKHLSYTQFTFALQLVLWGIFKKLVIADRCATYVNTIFDDYTNYSGITIIIAAILYSIQLYTDFSGCVDICRGIGELYGIKIPVNFKNPYLAGSVKEFWGRWHITLSTWLKDYIYIPLGGNRKGKIRKFINIFIVFIVSGLWHGVGYQYLIWGIMHAMFQILPEIIKPARNKINDLTGIDTKCFSYTLFNTVVTYGCVVYGWLWFRSSSVHQGIYMTKSILYHFFCVDQLKTLFCNSDFVLLCITILIFALISFAQSKISLRLFISKQNLPFRWIVYLFAIFTVIIFGVYGEGYDASDFLYMQF